MTPSYDQLRDYRRSHGLPWFDAAYDLNLLIIRGDEVGTWDGLVCLAYTDAAGQEVVESYPAATTAWLGEWIDPTHPDGCIYILDGQHVPAGYAPGMHRLGRHRRPALRQVEPFRYVRWGAGRVPTLAELECRALDYAFTGLRWTNLHARVSDRQPSAPARDDTEGCPLLRHRPAMARILALCELQDQHVGTDAVSPTFARRRDLS